MKTKLLFALVIGITSLNYSQELQSLDNNKLINYYLVNKSNDSTMIQGEILPIETIQRGFTFCDKTDEKIAINPNDFKYLFLKNSEGKTFNLKSLPFKRKTFSRVVPGNVFMTILIENSESELKKGKLNLYLHEFIYLKNQDYSQEQSVEWPSHMEKDIFIKSKVLYFEDLDGLHQIDSKSQFKKFPKVLGKRLFKKMRNSSKEKEQFLLDYFTKYNMKIVKL